MRIESSMKNVKIGWIMYMVHFFSQFIARTVIILTLSVEYVGLSGLFSNILIMLSLAELGIGEAIVFSLYGPIGRGEIEKIQAIMKFYRKVYILVGIIIIICGITITPFINYFIKGIPNIPHIHLIFILYVLNSATSYFFSYKATFIKANQRNYVVVVNAEMFNFISVILNSILLVITHNYILFMCIQIIATLLTNININRIANKEYPYLKEKINMKVPSQIFNEIKKNTAAMVFHKIGGIIVFATDNLIVSKFLGLITVGLYTNYYTVTSALMTFVNQFFIGVSASVGNLAVHETVEKQEDTLFKMMFVNFWMYTFVECGLFTMLNSFVGNLWLGKEYTLSISVVFLMVFKDYLTGMRQSIQTFKNAKGLYWQNKFMPIYESAINLIVSIILVKYMGLAGIIIGTIISTLTTCAWIEPHVLYKHGFKKKATGYVKKYLQYMFMFFITLGISWVACQSVNALFYGLIDMPGLDGLRTIGAIIKFGIDFIIVAVVSNGFLWIIYHKSEEYKYLIGIIKSKFLKHE